VALLFCINNRVLARRLCYRRQKAKHGLRYGGFSVTGKKSHLFNGNNGFFNVKTEPTMQLPEKYKEDFDVSSEGPSPGVTNVTFYQFTTWEIYNTQ
jgi:hypothetical protein